MGKMALAPQLRDEPSHPADGRQQASARFRRIGLAATAALIAVSAYGGALGLIAGFLDLGPTVTGRLPMHSPVLGGIALTVIVAVPCTTLAWLAARADQRAGAVAIAVGVLLIGWILVELTFIRELSFLHPAYVGLATLLIWLGARTRSDERAQRT